MKKLKNVVLCLCVLVQVTALQQSGIAKPKKISLKGKIEHYKGEELEFNYQPYALLEKLYKEVVKVDEDGNFELKLEDMKSPIRAFISLGTVQVTHNVHIENPDGTDTTMTMGSNDPRLVYFYLSPGEKLSFTVDADSLQQSLSFKGKHSADSRLMNEMDWNFNAYKDKHLKNYYSIVNYSPSELKQYADKTAAEKLVFLKEFEKKHKVSKHLYAIQELDALNTAASAKINYPYMRTIYVKDDKQELPADYYSFMDSVKLPQGLKNKGIGYFYFLSSYLQKKYELSGSKADFYEEAKNWLSGYEYDEYIAFALGADFRRKLYERFDEKSPYPDLAALVKEKYKHLEGMLEGSPAPVVTLQDSTGKKIQLSDLKGKFIYIDFWATWCGPCIKEIPYLKVIEKAYHKENIQFLSVSYDSPKDLEKWKKFVKENDMHGLQYWADPENKKLFSTAFNIQQIPRFVLIDPAGNIVNANAPRPSQSALVALLNKSLKGDIDPKSVEKDIVQGFSLLSDDLKAEGKNLLLIGENHSSSAGATVLPQILDSLSTQGKWNELFIEFGPSEAYFYQKYLDSGDEKFLRYTVNAGFYKDWKEAWVKIREVYVQKGQKLKVTGIDFDRAQNLGYALYNIFKPYENKPAEIDSLLSFVRNKDFFTTYKNRFPDATDSAFIAGTKAMLKGKKAALKKWLKAEDFAVVENIINTPMSVYGKDREEKIYSAVNSAVEASADKNFLVYAGREHTLTKAMFNTWPTLTYLLKQQKKLNVNNLIILHEGSDQWDGQYKNPLTLFDVSQKTPWKDYADRIMQHVDSNLEIVEVKPEMEAIKKYADFLLVAQQQPAIRF